MSNVNKMVDEHYSANPEMALRFIALTKMGNVYSIDSIKCLNKDKHGSCHVTNGKDGLVERYPGDKLTNTQVKELMRDTGNVVTGYP